MGHPDLPVEFQVVEYFPNAEMRDLGPGEAPRADRGLGREMVLEGKPKVKGTDTGGEVDMPSVTSPSAPPAASRSGRTC